MTRDTMARLGWNHEYVGIFRCSRRGNEARGGMSVEELMVADARQIAADRNLPRVVRALHRDLVGKRPYNYAQNPTSRLLPFRPAAEGEENEGRARLTALLRAEDGEAVRVQARRLAERYARVPRVRDGVLLFLLSRGTPARGPAARCALIFKCDFEDVSRITARELFRRVPDAIVEQTKKGAIYPYYTDGRFDEETALVFDAQGETGYWLEFLDLGERPPEQVQVQLAVRQALPPALVERYPDFFGAPPAVRSLAEPDHALSAADRLPVEEVIALNEQIVAQVGEQMVTLSLGDVRVRAPLGQYGRAWVLAETQDERYLLVRGSALRSHGKVLTPVDLARFSSLREAAESLGLAL